MELTSKQRAQLRGIANTLDTIVIIGKDGITENLIKQANDALEAREIIKCRVLENSLLTAREACDELSRLTRSEQVQVIGSKFVLYRQHYDKSKRKIELLRDKPGKKPKDD
ncbi:MAG TPA: YhbY family RNA-binding protein [Candidatus Pelethomonas intestinigallinarum]|nr:YhbY family RNA-binding protein [Candidatus Pelethomonas intestinigallinarum]